MGATRLVRPSRHARPMALVSAVATLLAALFFCLGAGPDSGNHHPEPAAGGTSQAGGTVRAEGTVRTTAAASVAAGTPVGEYICPFDRGGCSLFPSLSPAVLSAPPLDPPLHAEGGLPRLFPPPADDPAGRTGAQPRAPDLHVLQVLRT
ncbi:hypothetical protein ABT154_05560 [Streptomyces sp. NPDC001728]|uniref:hypothetical protein n=1 Tax=Streptomyces sp. NPDC001728 TaxID=3154396 RepID=UPI00332C686D